jgi:hypothetical protein
MAQNIAQKRAAKASRRKAVVAERRKLELVDSSLAAQIARAAQMPIQYCYLSERLFDAGIGTMILARGETSYRLAAAVFLIDAWDFGVKDAFFSIVGEETFENMLTRIEATGHIKSIKPADARKLLRDAAAWSASNGIAPYRDYAVIEKLFGDVNADDCDYIFNFGNIAEPVTIDKRDDKRVQEVQALQNERQRFLALEKQD